MRKFIKRFSMIISVIILLNTVKCLGYTEVDTQVQDNKLIKKYTVYEDEEQNFLESIQKDFEDETYKYFLYETKKTGGNYTEKKNIETTKTITLNTNDTQTILSELPATINYNEDEYIGKYILNTDNLDIKINYNGYTEYLIEQNKSYSDLSRNDLDFIPKQILKNGTKLDLLKVDWKVQSTKFIGDYEVADKYIANCYYAGKVKKDNPYTYTINATYTGTAEKEVKNPYQYILTYDIEKISNSNIVYMVTGGSLGIIVIFFIFRKNAKVYNLKNGEYKFVGRIYIRKEKANISRFAPFEKSNKYKIVISDRKIKKIENKMITIVKGKNKVKRLVNSSINNKPYTIEVTI